jgi:hypothetical protein
MKKILFVFVSTLLLSFTPSVWQEFKNLNGHFRVLTPTGVMTESLKKVKTDVGELTFNQYIYKPEDKKDDNVFYLVNYCDYPKGSFPKDSVEMIQAFLNETVESSAKSVYGKVSYSNDITLQMHKGKIWRVQYNNNNVQIKNKCFLVDDRFYLLQVMTLKEKSLNPSVDKFLDSFYLF